MRGHMSRYQPRISLRSIRATLAAPATGLRSLARRARAQEGGGERFRPRRRGRRRVQWRLVRRSFSEGGSVLRRITPAATPPYGLPAAELLPRSIC